MSASRSRWTSSSDSGALVDPVLEIAVTLGEHAEIAQGHDRGVQRPPVGDGVEVDVDLRVDGDRAHLRHEPSTSSCERLRVRAASDEHHEAVATGREGGAVGTHERSAGVIAQTGLEEPRDTGLDDQPVAEAVGEEPDGLRAVPADEAEVVVVLAVGDHQRTAQQRAGGGAQLGLGLQIGGRGRARGRDAPLTRTPPAGAAVCGGRRRSEDDDQA